MMNKTVISIITLFSLISCGSVENRKITSVNKNLTDTISSDKSFLAFVENKKSFGKVKKKKQAQIVVDFQFENMGDTPLVIIKADVSCKCLSTEYPKQPIKKGEKGVIKVMIDTKLEYGDFNKTVYIKSNAANDVELLRITGKIK